MKNLFQRITFTIILCVIVLVGQAQPQAKFHYFSYTGTPVVNPPSKEYNAVPLLAGCYPDPSICRVGGDYYMVNSTFAYFPGVPIFHSTNLKEWRQIGHVLNRPSQLKLPNGTKIRDGIYAPTIRYNPHNKKFYMITTNVGHGGNFYVTTDNPKSGEWSDPVFLPAVKGIDPDLFFEDNGRAYIAHSASLSSQSEYSGHCAIWLIEFDWKNDRTVGDPKRLIDKGVYPSKQPKWIEGPHLFKVNGKYHLICAEGGTGINHSEVAFIADSLWGPFSPAPINPILTQRDLNPERPQSVTSTGHVDMLQTPEGKWVSVFLGVRPYKDRHDVMGRETFMQSLDWSQEQPIVLSQGKALKSDRTDKVEKSALWSIKGLTSDAIFIRTPQSNYYTIDKQGTLVLDARPDRIDRLEQPSFIGRRITGWECTAESEVSFIPDSDKDFAGLACFQNDDCHFLFGKTRRSDGIPIVRLEVRSGGKIVEQYEIEIPKDMRQHPVRLRIEGDKSVNYRCRYALGKSKTWSSLGNPVSADWLSTHTAKGFTGSVIGIYATAAQ